MASRITPTRPRRRGQRADRPPRTAGQEDVSHLVDVASFRRARRRPAAVISERDAQHLVGAVLVAFRAALNEALDKAGIRR